MSIAWGTQYGKLKTNLRLAANRLKLCQKKKTELAMKARTEIADFLIAQKEDRARIRVESIIREDFLVEAYELLEMYCELLLARFGIIQQMKNLDDGIAEAVISLLWVAPRISHEISEFKTISEQLTLKYGKQFAEAARTNQLAEPAMVNPKLIQKLSVNAPSKLLVEKYLIEIAKCAGIDFKPDHKIMREDDDEVAKAEQNLINFMKEEQIGWSGSVGGPDNKNNSNGPPNFGSGGGGSGGGSSIPAFQYPPPNHEAPRLPPTSMYPAPNAAHHPSVPSFTPPAPPSYNMAQAPHGYDYPAPHDYQVKIPPNPEPGSASAPTEHENDHIYEVPPAFDEISFPEPPNDLPSYNNHSNYNSGGNAGAPHGGNTSSNTGNNPSNDMNFDELARRFDMLKKKL